MSNLSTRERREAILKLLHESGRVEVSTLSKTFSVSEVSIRNDLATLEQDGLVARVRGGAVSPYDPYYNMSLAQRSNTNRDRKEKIAERIASLIQDNQSVMMNAGTTTLAVMKKLASRKNINIVTNSIVLALEGAKHPNLHISLLGGDVNAEYQYVYGTATLEQLADYHADLLILSADGIDAAAGVTSYYDSEVDICRRMVSRCNKVIAALDGSKIGKVTFRRIADVSEVDVLITNEDAPKANLAELEAAGLSILQAD